jgi:hypothetical protein
MPLPVFRSTLRVLPLKFEVCRGKRQRKGQGEREGRRERERERESKDVNCRETDDKVKGRVAIHVAHGHPEWLRANAVGSL